MAKKIKPKWIQLGGSQNPVGYCHYHGFTMSKNQIKSKQCLEKNCPRLEKYDCDYWVQLEKNKLRTKELRQNRKQALKNKYKNMDRAKLKKAIEYCHKCPEGKDKALEYCSQCPYGEKCMAGIMEEMYKYITNYSD